MIFPQQIMIVEDEAITQRYLKEILQEKGVQQISDCFDNAEDAMKNVESETYLQLILMDINIKGNIDGIQLARMILDKYILPIVFISAYSDDETLEEVLELSPYGFITKPFSSKEVEVTLQIAYKRFLIHEAGTSDKNMYENEVLILNEEYSFDLKKKLLYFQDEAVKLNSNQNKFIEILAQQVNEAVPLDVLISNIWGRDIISDSALRTLVYTIRKSAPKIPLHSYSKQGYCLTSF